MKLLRTELRAGFHNKLFDMSARELPNRDTVFIHNHIICELSVKSLSIGFQISGKIKATLEYGCVRCLCPCPINLILPINLLLTGHKNGIEKQDIIHFPETQDQIDLTDSIADLISLAEPMKPVCDDNCRGLCPNCGKNINQTPCDCIVDTDDNPWDELKKLKLK